MYQSVLSPRNRRRVQQVSTEEVNYLDRWPPANWLVKPLVKGGVAGVAFERIGKEERDEGDTMRQARLPSAIAR